MNCSFVYAFALLLLILPGCISTQKVPEPSARSPREQAPDYLAAVCGEQSVGNRPEAGTSRFECSGCPLVAPASQVRAQARYEHAWTGSFTRKGVEEAWVVMTGCEPHAFNYGGAYLVRKEAGSWKRISYRQGWVPHQCLKFSTGDARQTEGLVCEFEWSGQGQKIQSLSAETFGPAGPKSRVLLKYGDNLGASFYPQGTIFAIERKAWSLLVPSTTPGAKSNPRLEVAFGLREATLSPDETDDEILKPAGRLGASRELKLAWTWRRNGFKLESSSRKAALQVARLVKSRE